MKQERWKSILKPLTILPVIVMLCTIFGFSNQNGTTSGGLSQKVSRQIVTVCDTLFHQDLAEETIEHPQPISRSLLFLSFKQISPFCQRIRIIKNAAPASTVSGQPYSRTRS